MTLEHEADTAEAYGALTRLYEHIQGAVTTQSLVAAVRLKIADALLAGEMELTDLARATGSDPVNLERLLGVLVSIDLVEQTGAARFGLRPLGRRLCADREGSLRDFCLLWGEPWFWNGLGRLSECVATGRSASRLIHGVEMFDRFDADPAAESAYNRALDALNEPLFLDALVGAYDFSRAAVIVDAGGGQGATLAALLKANPQAKGVVADRARLRGAADELLRGEGLEGRYQFAAVDFREHIPAGGDLYLLKWILVDWSDDDALRILRACRNAMVENARLIVVAGVGEDGSYLNRITDALLMAYPGGRTRRKSQIVELAALAGLDLLNIFPVAHQWIFEFGPGQPQEG